MAAVAADPVAQRLNIGAAQVVSSAGALDESGAGALSQQIPPHR